MTTLQLRLKSGTAYKQNRKLAALLADSVRYYTPVRSGKLRRGWRVTNYNSRSITVENSVHYGIWVDLGTPTIAARNFTQRGWDRFVRLANSRGVDVQRYYNYDINYW